MIFRINGKDFDITKSTGAMGSAHDPYVECPDDVECYGHNAQFFKRVSWVYAHGKLEEDMQSDIIYLYNFENNVMGMMGKLRNGFVAYYNKVNTDGTVTPKPVRFFLYKNPKFGHLQGIVTYCDDIEAYKYGNMLVEMKPERF